MGQKKVDRTRAWQRDQIDAEWQRRTEKALAEIKAKNEAKAIEEKKNGEEKNESENN